MTYLIHPLYFYLLQVYTTFYIFFLTINIAIFFVFLCIALIKTIDSFENKTDLKYNKKSVAMLILSICIITITPTPDTMRTMYIASLINSENLEKMENNTKELIDYVFKKVKEVENGNEM